MVETAQNVTLHEGDEPTLRFRLRELDENGTDAGVLNLTGMTVSWRMEGRPARAATIVDAAAGTAEVALLPADTTGRGGSAGDHSSYHHELRVTDAFGFDQIAAVGTIVVRGALHDDP